MKKKTYATLNKQTKVINFTNIIFEEIKKV